MDLNEIIKDQKLWLHIARKYLNTSQVDIALDVVHDMYIKVNEINVKYKGLKDINRFYISLIIRTIAFDRNTQEVIALNHTASVRKTDRSIHATCGYGYDYKAIIISNEMDEIEFNNVDCEVQKLIPKDYYNALLERKVNI